MQILKALVGGLAGGSIGVFVSDLLHKQVPITAPWALVLVGLGAGIGVRILCGKNRNFATGATAAIAAIVALLGISYAQSMRTLSTAQDPLQPVVTDWEDLDDEATEDAEEAAAEDGDTASGEMDDAEPDSDAESAESPAADMDADEAADEAQLVADTSVEEEADASADEQTVADQPPGSTKPLTIPKANQNAAPRQVDWRSKEVIMHGIAALLAYFLGTGAGVAATVATQPSSPESEPKSEE